MARVVFATFGSAGDLFPALAVARAMQETGDDVTLLAPSALALYARSVGVPVATVGSGQELEAFSDHDLYTTRFDGYSSWRRTCVKYLQPIMHTEFDRIAALVSRLRPDLVVVHPLAPFGSMVAEALGVPWVSLHLYPQLKPAGQTAMFGGALAPTMRSLERAHGLDRRPNPLLGWGWSPLTNLSVHDRAVVELTNLRDRDVGEAHGFPYWDDIPSTPEDLAALDRIDGGSPVLVATLGSFIGMTRPDFWPELARVVDDLGWSAVFTGVPAQRRADVRSPNVVCTGYVPMSQLMARASIVLHHGGIGTTYAALLAGVPAVVFAQAFDQSFNARLVEELGVGRAVRGSGDLLAALHEASADATYRTAARGLQGRLTDPVTATTAICRRLRSVL